jgi:cell division protein FtsQ
MGRKPHSGTGMLPGMEPEEDHPVTSPASPLPPPFSARSAGVTPSRRAAFSKRSAISRARLLMLGIAALLLAGASMYAFLVAERFLIRDPRFVVSGSQAGGNATLKIIGAHYASLGAIETVFASDLGRSLYLVPLEDRLTTLRAVGWVRDASVARIWPNTVLIRVSERVPVAFLALPGSAFGMIDADGVILPRVKGNFSLPVLVGVKPADPIAKRREGVGRMLRAAAELGSAMQYISEVDVSDPENLIVSQSGGGGILRLMLGDRNFAVRYQNFVKNYDQIRAHAPDANELDLRLEDRVIAVEN